MVITKKVGVFWGAAYFDMRILFRLQVPMMSDNMYIIEYCVAELVQMYVHL